jgi:hypothetical protein
MQHNGILCNKIGINWSFGIEALEILRLGIRLKSVRI